MPHHYPLESFERYFENQISYITEIGHSPYFGDLHAKILYMAILEALATLASSSEGYKEEGKRREKVVSLVRKYASWKECDRVSLPILEASLLQANDPKFYQLGIFVSQELKKWPFPEDNIVEISWDPEMVTVEEHWPRNGLNPESLGSKKHFEFQHVNLLYTYRNSLVHEFRPLSGGMSSRTDFSPYYSLEEDYDERSNKQISCSVELNYPVAFFEKICREVLKNLTTHLLKTEVNLSVSSLWGPPWLKIR